MSSDPHLAEVAVSGAVMLRMLAERWRFRIQAGRLGDRSLDEALELVSRLDAAARLLDEETPPPAVEGGTPHESEERFRLLIDGVTDYAIFMLDRDGRIASWNSGAERINGYRAEEILGRHLAAFYPSEEVTAGKPARELEAATRDGRFVEEGWRVRKDGSRYWAHMTLTALRDGDGAVRGFAEVIRDATEVRRVHEALRQSEERLRLMIEAVRDYAIFMLDPSGRIASWNLGAERLKGYRADEIIGKHFSIFYPDEDRARLHPEQELRQALRDGRYEEEGWRLRKDGSRFWANVVITAIHDGEGRHLGFTKVTRDVTEQRRLRDAQVAIQVRDEFLAVASHELKTPLAALLLHIQSLARTARADDTAPMLKQRLDKAAGAGKRLEKLIDQMMDVSRITSGRFQLEPEPVVLDELVREVIDRYSDDSTFELRLEPGIQGVWDRLRLDQVLTNLIANAVKYGKGRPISVSAGGDGGRAKIAVTDRGIGIEPDQQQRIFERFERAVPSREYVGFGLGLWISRRIVEASGGTIAVESVPGEGATFIVDLPLLPPKEDDVAA